MISASTLLLADGTLHSKFELGGIQNNSDWILPLGACLVILLFVRAMYRRDAAELPRLWGWFFTLLRAATFLGLLFLFLQPQWRTEIETTHNSRVALLVDTSLSMGLNDSDSDSRLSPSAPSRIQQVASGLAETELLAQLRKTHDVAVYKFNNNLDRDLVWLDKLAPRPEKAAPERRTPRSGADWRKFLTPAGTETRLGEALQQLLHQERSTPLAGVVLLSDGGLNAGAGPEGAIESAHEANVPIFTVGLGSETKPLGVRVNDLAAPVRAYPGNRYPVTGFLQAQRLAGKPATVQLLSRELDPAGDRSRHGTGTVEGIQQILLGGDGEITPVRFELTPKKEEVGRRILCLRIQPVPGVRDSADMIRETDIEIVNHKNSVLLLAGGPTREYQFVRTLLHRDRSVTVNVFLQTAQQGVSQDANKILSEFPSTREAMSLYDCVVAFDPDWQALTQVEVNVLHDWVDGQGGGLIAVAGPVYAGKGIDSWLQDPAMAKIRNLYPVEFLQQFPPGADFAYTSKEPWPLNFTREGQQADFLWLGEGVTASRQAWTSFAGVFSFFPVHGPKPAATVLATYSDPRAADVGKEPPYFVEQFYGSGRVFYMGSGEMWRVRRLDPAYFDQFYTKLIRHVSQGRLLRGSSRGVLLPGQDRYLLGNTVEVRAQLTNARLQPLADKSVVLEVIPPGGAVQMVTLAADPTRAGNFAGQFQVLEEGAYRLELPVPESQNERLTRRIQVKVPELERENPQLNAVLLQRIAEQTQGKYFEGMPALLGIGGKKASQPLVKLLEDRTNVDRTTVAPIPSGKRPGCSG